MEIVGNQQTGNERTPRQLLGSSIKAWRESKGIMSQRRFAEMLGIQQATFNKIEIGERLPTREQALAIAKALDYGLGELHLLYPERYPAPPAPEVTEVADDIDVQGGEAA